MGWVAVDWASKQTIQNSNAKLVLIRLASHVPNHDLGKPAMVSQETIIEELGGAPSPSRRTVQRCMKLLDDELGLIRRQHRGKSGGGRTSDLTWLNIPQHEVAEILSKAGTTEPEFGSILETAKASSVTPLMASTQVGIGVTAMTQEPEVEPEDEPESSDISYLSSDHGKADDRDVEEEEISKPPIHSFTSEPEKSESVTVMTPNPLDGGPSKDEAAMWDAAYEQITKIPSAAI